MPNICVNIIKIIQKKVEVIVKMQDQNSIKNGEMGFARNAEVMVYQTNIQIVGITPILLQNYSKLDFKIVKEKTMKKLPTKLKNVLCYAHHAIQDSMPLKNGEMGQLQRIFSLNGNRGA